MPMRDTPLRTLGLLCSLQLLLPDGTQAQEPSTRPWSIVAGVTALELSGDKGWAFGPTLGIRRMVSRRVSLDLDASIPVTNSGSDKFDTAVLGNFGPSLVWRSPRHDFAVSMGISAGTLLEDSGGQASTVGVFGALGGTYWFGVLGVSGRAAYHIWYGDPGAELSAWMAARF
jgi:hypothetical protein